MSSIGHPLMLDGCQRALLTLPTVQAIHQIVTGTPGHPDQFPHIDSWLLITQTLPPWARFSTTDRDRVGFCGPTTQIKGGKKRIFQGDAVEDPLLPLKYVPLTPQAPAQPAPDPLPDSPPPSMSPTLPHEQDSSLKPIGNSSARPKKSNQLAVARQMPL